MAALRAEGLLARGFVARRLQVQVDLRATRSAPRSRIPLSGNVHGFLTDGQRDFGDGVGAGAVGSVSDGNHARKPHSAAASNMAARLM